MQKSLLILLLSILAYSCSNSASEKIPDTVLSNEQMVKLLVAIHLEEANQNMLIVNQQQIQPDTLVFDAIFQKHSVTKAQYDSSMLYYSRHPELLDKIYDDVISELGADSVSATK